MSSTGTAILLSSLYPQNSKHRKVNTDYTERIIWDRVTFIYILMQIQHSPWNTVYPKKYAHGFCFAVLCCGYTLTDFPISIRLTSLALWQSNDCPSASKATLMNMDKYFMWIHYERLHNHNKAKHNKTVCIFLGIYCIHTRYGFRIYASGYLFVIDNHRGTTWSLIQCTITSISTSRSIKFYSEFLNFHSRNHMANIVGKVSTILSQDLKKIDALLSSIDESQWLPPKIYWYNAICIFGTDAISNMPLVTHGPLTRYVKLPVAHAPEMPGKFSPPLAAGGFLWSRWRMNENELYHVPGNGGLSLMSDWYMSI